MFQTTNQNIHIGKYQNIFSPKSTAFSVIFQQQPTLTAKVCTRRVTASWFQLKKLLTILSQTLPSELLITWPEKRRVARSCEQLNITGY